MKLHVPWAPHVSTTPIQHTRVSLLIFLYQTWSLGPSTGIYYTKIFLKAEKSNSQYHRISWLKELEYWWITTRSAMPPCDAAFVFDDINDVLSSIETMLNDVLDRHIPLKSKRVKRPNQPGTKEILHSKKTRDKLLKRRGVRICLRIGHDSRMRRPNNKSS